MECMGFLTNFRKFFASFTPTAGSITTSLLEIMVPKYAFSEKHKNILNYRTIFQSLHCKNRNICNFRQFLGKFLPYRLQLFVL